MFLVGLRFGVQILRSHLYIRISTAFSLLCVGEHCHVLPAHTQWPNQPAETLQDEQFKVSVHPPYNPDHRTLSPFKNISRGWQFITDLAVKEKVYILLVTLQYPLLFQGIQKISNIEKKLKLCAYKLHFFILFAKWVRIIPMSP